MSSEVAIKLANLSKCYQIYDNPRDRLKQFVLPRFQRLVGRELRRYYREFWALKDVSIEIKKGETVGIVGRNGSGKSTLLQMICGTLNPTSGEIQANGRISALLELGSGFNPEFTGRENVYMNAAILGLTRDEIDDRFDDIASFADIGDFIDQPVKSYSSGMAVRLAFSVAIRVQPQILVVDEALSVGDELFQRKCFAMIEALREAGTTILFVSHSGATVVELCDRAILLDGGDLIAVGTPKRIVSSYQKLLYAPSDKRDAVRNAIARETLHGTPGIPAVNETESGPTRVKLQESEDAFEESFDPNLKPQSTVEYETRGAYIEAPEILTLSGAKVNCLKRGKRYRYRYSVRLDRPATNLRFGMLIKTITGLELGGAVSASAGRGMSIQKSGTLVYVEYHFTCNLNPGLYFLNAGVTADDQDEEIFLHRVLDICMFRVLPLTENVETSIVHFDCKAEIDFSMVSQPRQVVT